MIRAVTARGPARPVARDISELSVLLQFGELVVAIAAQRVAHIVLADEAVAVAGAVPSVRVGDAVLPAWELGKLLGLVGPPAAWLVMTTSDEPGAPRIALGTGPCLAIATHAEVSPLPDGVVTAPPAAVTGVFATDPALRARGAGQLAIQIDPMRLIGWSVLAGGARRGER
ncbi:MAG TPA: hypothetical protein VFK02_04745 [Kofleriaceae bacterium]|nr:hypothetical protein [Kofleriaceae bacterium]